MWLPYVYIVRNRLTKEYYIGMRSANKVVAEQDFGIKYFTSSKYVRKNFDNFDATILAYFVNQVSAFEYENNLIQQNWGDPLMINKHYQKSMSKFSMTGSKRSDLSDFNSRTKSKPKENRNYQCRNCGNEVVKLEFCHHGPKEFYYCNASCRNNTTLRPKFKKTLTNEKKYKETLCENCGKMYFKNVSSKSKCCSMSCSMKIALKDGGHPAWNKGLANPLAAENGRKGSKKQSMTVKGRKRKYLENGKWTWEYPATSVTEQAGSISES